MNAKPAELLLEVENLKTHFPIYQGLTRRQTGAVRAVDGVTFDVRRGETLSLVGESGSGKSTLGRTILQLIRPTAGQIRFQGQELSQLTAGELRPLRRKMQMVFQDPYASLSPRMRVLDIVGDPLRVHRLAQGRQLLQAVGHLLEIVGLNPVHASRYPHEFSGGQRQRIAIARALALRPLLIVCDEPISSLDVSIQAQIVNLLRELQQEYGLAYLFIAHDLSMVRYISDRVAVMYLGKLMELADRRELFDRPLHPYTQALLSALPIPDPKTERIRKRIILSDNLPSPAAPPPGCPFSTRCPVAVAPCFQQAPEWRQVEPGRWVACHKV